MMDHIWFPWYPELYRADTRSLTPAQDGIYRRLIDEYMITARPLPEDMIGLSRAAGVSVQEMEDAWSMLRAYFKHTSGIGWCHTVCDEIMDDMQKRSEKRTKKAKNAAASRWKKHKKTKGLRSNKKRDATSNATSNAQAMLGDATLHNITKHIDNSASASVISKSSESKMDQMKAVSFDSFSSDWIKKHDLTKELVEYCLEGIQNYFEAQPKRLLKYKDFVAFARNWIINAKKGEQNGNYHTRSGKNSGNQSIHSGNRGSREQNSSTNKALSALFAENT